MAPPPAPSKGLLTQKLGPIPVWGWGAGSLVAAYAWSRYRANKAAGTSAATTAASGTAGEPAAGAPYYVIENNVPPQPGAGASSPIPSPTGQPPVSGPPSTAPSPPTNTGPAPGSSPAAAPAPAGQAVPESGPGRLSIPGSTYKVMAGDTLTSIATRNKVPGGAAALWAYQLDPAHNPASQIAVLRQRGPNHLLPGETIRIPPRTA